MAAYQARHSPYPGHSAQLYSIHATKRVRPLWVILALLLVVEAWLWDHLEPIVARVVNFVPWRKLKIAVARWIEDLPPYAALGVFVVPFIVVFAGEIRRVVFHRHRQLVWLHNDAFACKIVWSRRDCFRVRRNTSQASADFRGSGECTTGSCRRVTGRTRRSEPIRARIRKLLWMLQPERARRTFRRLLRLRRSYRNRPA
jgi:hypothetical protein